MGLKVWKLEKTLRNMADFFWLHATLSNFDRNEWDNIFECDIHLQYMYVHVHNMCAYHSLLGLS